MPSAPATKPRPEDPRCSHLTGAQEINRASAHDISAARTLVGVAVTVRMFPRRFFLMTGVLTLGYTALTVAARHVYQSHESRVFDEAVARQAAPRSNRDLARKIAIPRLNISAIIKEGVDDRTLDLAAGHIPDTTLPGEAGNVGVAAHRDTLFRNLKDVRRDNKITLTTLEGEYIYPVVSTQVVQPTDVSVLDPSSYKKTLTLVTCYPFYFVRHAPKRFIVHAVQVFWLTNAAT